MKSAKITQFKAELSKYLRYVRKGEEVVILDRTTPLACVLPFKQEENFLLEEAIESAQKLFSIRVEPIPGLKNSLEFLREERAKRGHPTVPFLKEVLCLSPILLEQLS